MDTGVFRGLAQPQLSRLIENTVGAHNGVAGIRGDMSHRHTPEEEQQFREAALD
jgi:hypothetical protein